MGLLQAMIGAFALYFLLHLYLLPRLHRRLPQASLANAYAQIVSVLLAEVAHAAALVIGLSLAAIIFAIWLMSQLNGHVSQAQLAEAYEFLRETRESIGAVSEWWGICAIAFLCLMLWLSLKNEAKRQFGKAANAAVEKLKADFEEGKLPDLPPTEEMAVADAAIDARRKSIADILDRANATGGDQAKADPKRNPELARLATEAEALSKHRFNLDMRRRLDLGSQIAATQQPPTRNLLLSRRFFQLVSGTTRVMSLLSLALLAPALVAITGPQISAAALEGSVALHDLILKNSLTEAKASWEKGIGHSDKEHQLDPEDQAVIDQMSQQYAHLVHQEYGRLVSVPDSVVRSISQYAVREKLLNDFALAHPKLSVGANPVASGEPAKQKALVEAVATMQSDTAPADGVAERFRSDLTAEAKTADPGAWKNFRSKAALALKAALDEPVQAETTASRLVAEVLNTAGRAIGVPGADNAIHLLAENLIEPGELFERAHELNRLNQYRFLNEILTQGSIKVPPSTLTLGNVPLFSEQGQADLRTAVAALDRQLSDANRAWLDHPPSLLTPPHGGQDLVTAQRVMREFLDGPRAQTLRGARLADALATYADYFPGVLGEEAHTPRAVLVSSAVRGEELAASAMQTAFVRARSYGALRGFAKIGGVLIGLAPSDGKGPNIVDLRWEDHDNGIHLKLTRSDGAVLSYGPFRAELIRLALAYAADGRPITVTMPAAEVGRKVLMHPALLDSALGCEARQLDQFVDKFTSRWKERTDASNRVESHLNTYRFAWASQFKRLTAQKTFPSIPQSYLKDTSEEADLILGHATIRKGVEQTLRDSDAWRDVKLSPVTSKSDYFEQGLVATAGRCLTSSSNVESFRQCIVAAPLDPGYVDSLKWALFPPLLFSESGVREQSYGLDSGLQFLDLQLTRNATWPFSFIVQVTFETPGIFASDTKKEFDEHPFEYPSLRSGIERLVTSGIAATRDADFDAARVMNDMREFTVLQRLFRLAFEGKLGDRFPLEALVELNKVKPHKPTAGIRTPVWNNPEVTNELLRQTGLTQLSAPLGLDRDLNARPPRGEGCPVINP